MEETSSCSPPAAGNVRMTFELDSCCGRRHRPGNDVTASRIASRWTETVRCLFRTCRWPCHLFSSAIIEFYLCGCFALPFSCIREICKPVGRLACSVGSATCSRLESFASSFAAWNLGNPRPIECATKLTAAYLLAFCERSLRFVGGLCRDGVGYVHRILNVSRCNFSGKELSYLCSWSAPGRWRHGKNYSYYWNRSVGFWHRYPAPKAILKWICDRVLVRVSWGDCL